MSGKSQFGSGALAFALLPGARFSNWRTRSLVRPTAPATSCKEFA
jgi:hypothetical protein